VKVNLQQTARRKTNFSRLQGEKQTSADCKEKNKLQQTARRKTNFSRLQGEKQPSTIKEFTCVHTCVGVSK